MKYDGILLASYGGPRAPEDVVPFLRNATAGRGIPDARLEEVGEHYFLFGGASPINEQNEALRRALESELADRGIALPVRVGNRNWDPYFPQAIERLAPPGGRILAVITAAYHSYSGCRQYREDFARAAGGRQIDKIRPYFNSAGFVSANAARVIEAFAVLAGGAEESSVGAVVGRPSQQASAAAELIFVTHSIPETMERASGVGRPQTYSEQHLTVCELLARRIGAELGREISWQLAYCSRSGPEHVPWLEPDINDVLEEAARRGVGAVVIAPIGFISDHMEVKFDLDTEAAQTAQSAGITMVRAGTVGTHPEFVRALADLIVERAGGPAAPMLSEPLPWACGPECCHARDGQEAVIPTLCNEGEM